MMKRVKVEIPDFPGGAKERVDRLVAEMMKSAEDLWALNQEFVDGDADLEETVFCVRRGDELGLEVTLRWFDEREVGRLVRLKRAWVTLKLSLNWRKFVEKGV